MFYLIKTITVACIVYQPVQYIFCNQEQHALSSSIELLLK